MEVNVILFLRYNTIIWILDFAHLLLGFSTGSPDEWSATLWSFEFFHWTQHFSIGGTFHSFVWICSSKACCETEPKEFDISRGYCWTIGVAWWTRASLKGSKYGTHKIPSCLSTKHTCLPNFLWPLTSSNASNISFLVTAGDFPWLDFNLPYADKFLLRIPCSLMGLGDEASIVSVDKKLLDIVDKLESSLFSGLALILESLRKLRNISLIFEFSAAEHSKTDVLKNKLRLLKLSRESSNMKSTSTTALYIWSSMCKYRN